MRFTSFFALSALVATVAATNWNHPEKDGFPRCAIRCLEDAPTGNCRPGEEYCMCKQRAFIDYTSKCFTRKCDRHDIDDAFRALGRGCHHGHPGSD